MNIISKVLTLSIFALAFSAQANEDLWDAVSKKDKERAKWILQNDRTADISYSRDGMSVLQLIEQTEQWDLLEFVGAAHPNDDVQTTIQLPNAPARTVLPDELGSLMGRLFIGGGVIHEQVGFNVAGAPFRTITQESRRPVPAAAEQPSRTRSANPPATPTTNALSELEAIASQFSAPRSQLAQAAARNKRFPCETDFSTTNYARGTRVVEELQLTTGTIIFVFDHERHYRVKWTNAERMSEIEDLVRGPFDLATLKKKLKEKGLL